MSNKVKAAFLVVAPESNRSTHKSVIETPAVELSTIMVSTYKEAVEESIKLVQNGVKVIELCGGFGNKGVDMISKAVEYKIPVGVVRFDNHPAFNSQSGDELFN